MAKSWVKWKTFFRNTDVWKHRFVKEMERRIRCFKRDRCMRSAFSSSSSPTVLLRSHHRWGFEKDEPDVGRAEQWCSVLGGNQAEETLDQLSLEWGREKPRGRERRRDNLGCLVKLTSAVTQQTLYLMSLIWISGPFFSESIREGSKKGKGDLQPFPP